MIIICGEPPGYCRPHAARPPTATKVQQGEGKNKHAGWFLRPYANNGPRQDRAWLTEGHGQRAAPTAAHGPKPRP